MYLQRLIIHNIASIADATIDFQSPELSAAPLFLICGDTGSGKSTILDAICLALYGETPRMTSAPNDAIELSDQSASQREKLKANDNSQLLRRGTGEGFAELTFTANDGRDYTARWTVRRNHGKAHKRLQKPTRSLVEVNGKYAEQNLKPIREKIKEIVGLDYDQFCRTAMLAQGEFTRFLKSRTSDKSAILEKLTGTEIYSNIGQRIALKYNTLRQKWEQLRQKLQNVSLLSDEKKEELKARQATLEGETYRIAEQRLVAEKKLSWLGQYASLAALRKAREEEEAKTATLVQSEAFQAERQLSILYASSAIGRRLLGDIKLADAVVAKDMTVLPDLEHVLEDDAENLKTATLKHEEAKASVRKLNIQLNSLNPGQVETDLLSARKQQASLAGLLTTIKELEGKQETLKVKTDHLKDLAHETAEAEAKFNGLETPFVLAGENLKNARSALHAVELSLSEAVNDLRASLRKGDTCPVCGNTIDTITDKSILSPLLDKLRSNETECNALLVEITSERKACTATIAKNKKLEKSLRSETASYESEIRKLLEELLRGAAKENLTGMEADSLKIEIDMKNSGLKTVLPQLEEKFARISALRKSIADANESEQKAAKILLKAKDKAAQSSAALMAMKSKLEADRSQGEKLRSDLTGFLDGNKLLTEESLKELSEKNPIEMDILASRIASTEQNLLAARSRVNEVLYQLHQLESARPEIAEEQTPDSLKEEAAALDIQLQERQHEQGAIVEMLRRDDEDRMNHMLKLIETDRAHDEMVAWEPLYQALGDQKGDKFRGVAQSFILKSLLDGANRYLASFSDRYTLTCNPGTLAILVNDNFRPSDPQPASILSGGESFMASLALALALADIRSQGMTLDIIFIDEGFGTLSPEFLGNVIDTLEKLHNFGGRRVGLISHVDEMRERIPVHINVVRESPAKSRIEIHSGLA